MHGRYCRLEPVDPARHAVELHAAYGEADDDADWTYLPYGPFADQAAFTAWLTGLTAGSDQQTPAATEAMYLMMATAFECGYRRYEWKCDDLNAPSRAAAERLGFVYEGTFRQATHYKNRNRDTAWYSILETEWPVLRPEFERWLDPDNFDESGTQRSSLGCRPRSN